MSRSRAVMHMQPFSAYPVLADSVWPLAPGTGTAVVSNPADIMLAYNYAANVAKNRRARMRAAAALRNTVHDWRDIQDGIASGAIGQATEEPEWIFKTARWNAKQQGVEGLFMFAVGEVAAANAVEQAVQATGEEATPEDESFLTWAWKRMMQAREYNQQLVDALVAQSPSAIAQRAVLTLAETWKATVKSELQETRNWLSDEGAKGRDFVREQGDKGMKFAKETIPELMKPVGWVGSFGVVTAGVVALLGLMWLMPRGSLSTR